MGSPRRTAAQTPGSPRAARLHRCPLPRRRSESPLAPPHQPGAEQDEGDAADLLEADRLSRQAKEPVVVEQHGSDQLSTDHGGKERTDPDLRRTECRNYDEDRAVEAAE